MEHILNTDQQSEELNEVFLKIRASNTVLFLGAGASVGEKKYLSKELIELYEAKINKKLNEGDITKWIDFLSADVDFDRSDFDNFVANVLQKLPVTEAHEIMAGISWREIITSNYDLLVEKAFDQTRNTSQNIYTLKPIRSLKQYNYKESNSEVRYIKLNGCISDKSLYPLAFSTDDFQRLRGYHKSVLNDLKNVSPEIQFLSVGYSYKDDFGKELLNKFDSYNYRDKRWIYNVDPFPNEDALPYYKKNKICVIKSSFKEFFLKYKKWETDNANIVVRKKGLFLSNSKDYHITASPQLLINLDGLVKQLNSHTREPRFIKDEDFYKGEEPTFNLIMRGVDVIKSKFVKSFTETIRSVISKEKGTFIPIFFINGDFGIGKSTFTLRLIYELEKQADLDLVAFEIIDFNRIRKEYMIDLVKVCKSKNFVFFCDEIEVESHFKALIELQRDISIEQFQDCNIFFLAPIRENILEKYKLNRNIPNSHELCISGEFEPEEIDDLLEKLKNTNLVRFKDAREKKRLLKTIIEDYNSDSFIALMASITSGKHESDLLSCYNQLSREAQQAFLFTALLHKHKLLMPANWLKQNIKMDWDEFTTKIIKAEGKGILIQEFVSSHGAQPDLYFRTKHPLIAQKLVDNFIPNKDKQFQSYLQMLKQIESGQTNSYLANNLLKTFKRSGLYNDSQIDKLFEAAYTKLSDDPYFLLNYAINLQGKKSKEAVKKAIDLIIYAESLLDFRNHKFVHRRAVLNFELAKLYFEEDDKNFTLFYMKEAEQLFTTKQILDPFSSFSYVDYIKFLVWQLEKLEIDEEDKVRKEIQIEELFDVAVRTVTNDISRIDNLQTLYGNYLSRRIRQQEYLEYLEGLYANPRLRPYACILKYNYFLKLENSTICSQLVSEMESLLDNFEVLKFLFKVYGRNLHDFVARQKFVQLAIENPLIETENPLRYNYFKFIAESYNGNFYEGRKYLKNIQNKFYNLNPEFHYEWKDSNGEILVFDATIVKRPGERFKAIKILSNQLTARLIKGSYDKYDIGVNVRVKLHFYLYGLMAEIVE